MKDAIKAFKALSDETRLRILNLLMERECCVCEVMQALDISQTRASRNLNALYDAGFLKMHKEGLWSVYALDKEGMPHYLAELIKVVPVVLRNNPEARADRRRLKKAQRVGPGCATKRRR